MVIIDTDKDNLDIPYIYRFLSTSYWAKDRSLEVLIRGIENSLCFGVYLDKQQIGFARVLTDTVVFSYIMDVFIDESYAGKGYGGLLLDNIYNHKDLVGVKNHYLLTKDAQEFYQKHGFEVYSTPDRFMLKIKK